MRLWNPPLVLPWQCHSPSVDTSLAVFKKNDISSDEFRARALELIASYRGYVQIYTDGSETSHGVGCSFIQGHERRSFSLPALASVFTSELVAILKAVCYIEVTYGDKPHAIFSDSLSSLTALKTYDPSSSLVQDILLHLHDLHRNGRNVTFC